MCELNRQKIISVGCSIAELASLEEKVNKNTEKRRNGILISVF